MLPTWDRLHFRGLEEATLRAPDLVEGSYGGILRETRILVERNISARMVALSAKGGRY